MPLRRPEGSFEAVFLEHQTRVLRFAQRRLTDDAAAWDVVSETFLAAWRNRDRVPVADEEVAPWLYALAGNVVRNHRRSQARSLRLVAKVAAAPLDGNLGLGAEIDVADDVVGRDRLQQALAALSEGDLEVLRLVAWEGLGPAELATALDIDRSAAKVRLSRARRRLREQLTETDVAAAASAAPSFRRLP